MSTHSGIQLILIGLFLLGGFAAVLTALLRRNRNPRAVPALVAVVAFLFLCLGSVVMVLVQTMQNSGMVLFMLNRIFSSMAHTPPWRRCSAESSCCRAALRWSSSRSLLYWK